MDAEPYPLHWEKVTTTVAANLFIIGERTIDKIKRQNREKTLLT